MLTGASKSGAECGEPSPPPPSMQVPVPATIRAENPNAINRAFSSYAPSKMR